MTTVELGFSEFLKERRVNVESQVSFSVEAANALMAKLQVELEPFRMITHEMCPWEKSAAVWLANKLYKSKRNKRWRKAKKRKHIAEMIAKERERFEEADREADEWKAREIAKLLRCFSLQMLCYLPFVSNGGLACGFLRWRI